MEKLLWPERETGIVTSCIMSKFHEDRWRNLLLETVRDICIDQGLCFSPYMTFPIQYFIKPA